MGNMRFKLGDRVRIKSIDWYNRYTNGTEVDCGAYPFTLDMKEFCGQERIIANVCQECYVLLGIDDKFVFTDEMIEGLVEEETKHSTIEEAKTYWDSIKDAWICPDGYIFKDENGNVINAKKIVLEKKEKEYPKTYEECCEIVKVEKKHTLEGEIIRINNYKIALLESFQKLLICRDAYWKIYGEEMGLGKPWEPDCSDFKNTTYGLYAELKYSILNPAQFEFPTEEMRDAFYENFKKEIEICKKLL